MQSLLSSYGLNLTKVCWEDVGRINRSCWGPNISDMTLFSNGKDCPVIRKPNFTDITVDYPLNNFMVTVGNENNTDLIKISLGEYLTKLNISYNYDEKIICSTQACILNDVSSSNPSFNVRLYNYQTTEDNPAVLVITSSYLGTSAQVLDSKVTDLLFNKNGRAYDYVAERLEEQTDTILSNIEQEKNVLYIFQIPLRVPDNFSETRTRGLNKKFLTSKGFNKAMLTVSDNDKGEFKSLKDRLLIRNISFPIRCTLQYYWITDDMNKLNDEKLVNTIANKLNSFN